MTLVDVEVLLLHHAVAYRSPETLIVGPQCRLELGVIAERHGVVCLRGTDLSHASERMTNSRLVATLPTEEGSETRAISGHSLVKWLLWNPEACAVFTRVRRETFIPDHD